MTVQCDLTSENFRVLKVGCPECQSEYAYFDEDRSEVFCNTCGVVLMWNPPYTHGYPALNSAVFNVGALQQSVLVAQTEEYRFKQSQYSRNLSKIQNRTGKKHGNKKLWRRSQYHRYVRVVNTNIFMTPHQKERAHFLIEQVNDFRKLHARNNYEFLVTGICLYSIEEHNSGVTDFSHPFLLQVGLGEDDYERIREKLNEF